MFGCARCGAAIDSVSLHARWHEYQDKRVKDLEELVEALRVATGHWQLRPIPAAEPPAASGGVNPPPASSSSPPQEEPQ